FVHAQLVTSFLLLLAFPPLEAAAVLQLMDRLAHTSFFLPTGLVISGQALGNAGGGNPLLWQHLFWFLAHPEVYVLILPALGIVGLTGLPLGLATADLHLHDTYYVIGHFHYVVAPGTIFAMFAGVYYWFPKITGRRLNEFWGKVHFWISLVCINGIFFPMFMQ